ncbi:hypothetical protein M408DRAFT_329558 [Serendipita vermifera MAFF 305830]|uniref:Uncharacterized protein n=1 Tax=Serendipita vermifera MAFF 305830 TaxID=933852 RepID=A0A0C3AUF2_SERVB|nr:hypothetical protein M408DRAFT_329558 [Serendipita vermifera MAFF 305830]
MLPCLDYEDSFVSRLSDSDYADDSGYLDWDIYDLRALPDQDTDHHTKADPDPFNHYSNPNYDRVDDRYLPVPLHSAC